MPDGRSHREGPSAVAIGNFDGVHRGHSRILKSAAAFARREGIASVALTFDPHPLKVVSPALAPRALTSLRQRSALIRLLGIEAVEVLDFTPGLSRLSPRDFAECVLCAGLGTRRVFVGGDFRFGRQQAGNVSVLTELGRELGFGVERVGTVLVGGEAVSSTRVRHLVRGGRVREARRLLGRDFSLQGGIVRGEGIGAKQTVPTLNLAPESEVLPADGVYISLTRFLGEDVVGESVTNVGLRPTFNGRQRTVETFLLAGLEAGVPKAIELRFLRKIRDERRFPSAQSLREQIAIDIETATRFFRRRRVASEEASAIP